MLGCAIKDEYTMQAVVEQIVNQSFKPPGNSGLVVGTLHGSQTSLLGFGRGNEDQVPPDGETIFEIGSVTKVFTATLLASLLGEGLLNLDDPVRDLLPIQSHLPSEITLQRLATHTSGLPKMPSNLLKAMLKERRNPYAIYSKEDLFEYLSALKLRSSKIMNAWVEYSNLGYVLLGLAIEEALGTSYEAALVERICSPVELKDTGITLSTQQQMRLVPPHSSGGRPAQNWNLEVFAGAGALRSTGSDLLKFLAVNLGRTNMALRLSMEACHTVRSNRFPSPGPLQKLLLPLVAKGYDHAQYHRGMALGWLVGRTLGRIGQIHWHHGATGGYRAFVGFIKERDVAAVVLANSGPTFMEGLISTTNTDEIGFRILEQLAKA